MPEAVGDHEELMWAGEVFEAVGWFRKDLKRFQCVGTEMRVWSADMDHGWHVGWFF